MFTCLCICVCVSQCRLRLRISLVGVFCVCVCACLCTWLFMRVRVHACVFMWATRGAEAGAGQDPGQTHVCDSGPAARLRCHQGRGPARGNDPKSHAYV